MCARNEARPRKPERVDGVRLRAGTVRPDGVDQECQDPTVGNTLIDLVIRPRAAPPSILRRHRQTVNHRIRCECIDIVSALAKLFSFSVKMGKCSTGDKAKVRR